MALSDKKIIFEKNQIMFFNKKTDFEHVVKDLANELIKQGLVDPDYPKQVILREKKFPTGLPTKPVGVSIPHTDAKWTLHNAIAIGILKHPIKQIVMGSKDKEVSVEIVFLLALDQSNKQLNILAKLMNVFQNPANLIEIKNGSQIEIKKLVEGAILEE